VIAIREHRASAARPRSILADRRVEVLGGGDLESLHPRSQRALVLGLDEQVHVRALNAEVDDPEVLAPGGRQRGLPDRVIDAAATQVADRADRTQHDMHRIACVQVRPLFVR
jgi:hypothetical protein